MAPQRVAPVGRVVEVVVETGASPAKTGLLILAAAVAAAVTVQRIFMEGRAALGLSS